MFYTIDNPNNPAMQKQIQANEASVGKNIAWLHDRIDAGSLLVGSQDYPLIHCKSSPNTKQFFSDLVNSCNSAFGSDGWDMFLSVYEKEADVYSTAYNNEDNVVNFSRIDTNWGHVNSEQFYYLPYIIIHYDSVEITNENNHYHVIKNLFVTIPIWVNKDDFIFDSSLNKLSYLGLCFGTMGGFRSTFYFGEWTNGYIHSHLHGRNEASYSRLMSENYFCLGEGPLAELIPFIGDSQEDWKMNEDTMIYFKECLDAFVKWESIEGTPYMYIEEIPDMEGVSNETLVAPEMNNSFYDEVVQNTAKAFWDSFYCVPKFKFIYNNNKPHIVFEDEHLEFIKKLCVYTFNQNIYSFLIYREVSGSFHGFVSHITTNNFNKEPYVMCGEYHPFMIYNKQRYYFDIITPDSEEEEIGVKIEDFNLRETFIQKLKNEINKQIYTNLVKKNADETINVPT